MGYVESEFGKLVKVTKNDNVVEITNSNGEKRVMSRKKYKESADLIYSKAIDLIGKEVKILTSQNTDIWSTSVWFSNIFEKQKQ